MSTTSLQKNSRSNPPGSLIIKYLLGKFDAIRYLPKLAYGFLQFNSAGELHATDAPTVNGKLTLGAGLVGSVQDLEGAGAVNLTTVTTKWTTTDADAGTLADGEEGQVKEIVMVADGGDGTLTPANFGNGTTITFDAVGESVVLRFLDGNWWVVGINGATVA